MGRLKLMLGLGKQKGGVEKVVESKICPELDSKVVGSVCRGTDRILKDYSKGKKIGEVLSSRPLCLGPSRACVMLPL